MIYGGRGTAEAPYANHNTSLADLHCINGSEISVHALTSDQDDAQSIDSECENRDDARSMDLSEVSTGSETDISYATKEDAFESDKQLVRYFRSINMYCTNHD